MQIFWRHPVAIIFLLFYTLLCIGTWRMGQQVHERGDGLGQAYMGLGFIGTIAFLVNCSYAIASKTKADTKFYLWMILIIIVETVAVFKVG